MTKVTVLGQEPEQKKLKPIEFTHVLNSKKEFEDGCLAPNDWENIELIYRDGLFDVMFAYDNDRNNGNLYLGHFNDGVVE